MPKVYGRLIQWLHSHPALLTAARGLVRFMPDWPLVRNVATLGPMSAGLWRHRWLWHSYPFGRENMTLGMFKRLVRPGDVFYDVGANIGYMMRFVVAHLPIRHLVAIEPMSANVKFLRRNVRLGHCEDRVTVLPIALADANGEEVFQVDDVCDGSAVLDRVSAGQPSTGRQFMGLGIKTERVLVRRLDDLIREEKLPVPQVIKIDTEGAERLVLQGGMQTLLEHRPRLAVATHGPQRARETVELLDEAGYASFGFVRKGGSVLYRQLSADDGDLLLDNNIVCTTEAEELRQPVEALKMDLYQ